MIGNQDYLSVIVGELAGMSDVSPRFSIVAGHALTPYLVFPLHQRIAVSSVTIKPLHYQCD